MAKITLGGTPVTTVGELPSVGSPLPEFELVQNDLSTARSADFAGKKWVLNVFPSVDTGVCAQSIRTFNQEAAELDGVQVLCISRDLPFAQARFCGAEGIDRVTTLSDFRDGAFGKALGLEFADGAFQGLHSRCVIVTGADGTVRYTEQVPETGQEPNYKAALEALMDA